MRTLSSKRSFDLVKNKNEKRPLGFFVVVCCAAPLFLVQSWAGQQQIRQKGNRRISPKRDRVKLSCCSWNSKTMRLPNNQHFYERWCFFFFCVCVACGAKQLSIQATENQVQAILLWNTAKGLLAKTKTAMCHTLTRKQRDCHGRADSFAPALSRLMIIAKDSS